MSRIVQIITALFIFIGSTLMAEEIKMACQNPNETFDHFMFKDNIMFKDSAYKRLDGEWKKICNPITNRVLIDEIYKNRSAICLYNTFKTLYDFETKEVWFYWKKAEDIEYDEGLDFYNFCK